MINWMALGEPRLDGSDTSPLRSALQLASLGEPFSLQAVARELDFVPKNKPFLSPAKDGIPRGASALLHAWPEGWRMAEDLLVALYPCDDPRFTGATVGGCYGCRSADLVDFGHVYASVTSPAAFVEGIVSSLANWKLYAVGIVHDQWDHTKLTQAVDVLHASPLRTGERVPAGSVIHMTYCCAHMLAYYYALLAWEELPHGTLYQARQAYVRVVRGAHTLRASVVPSTTGDFSDFLKEFLMWTDRLVAQASPEVR